jgi:hypothetical protein
MSFDGVAVPQTEHGWAGWVAQRAHRAALPSVCAAASSPHVEHGTRGTLWHSAHTGRRVFHGRSPWRIPHTVQRKPGAT